MKIDRTNMMTLAMEINTMEMPGPTKNTKMATNERYDGHINMVGTILKILVMEPAMSGCFRKFVRG